MTDDAISRDKARAMTDEMHRLGVDSDGNAHYVFAVRNVVWVENTAGDIGQIQTVGSIDDYVDFVDDLVGWDDLNYSGNSLGAELAAIVEAVNKQMEANA